MACGWAAYKAITLFPGSIRKFLDLRYALYRGRFRNWLHSRTHTKRCHTFHLGRITTTTRNKSGTLWILKSKLYFMEQQPPASQDLLIIEASRSHSGTPHWVGLLWTSSQPVAKTATWHHTRQKGIHAPGAIRTRNPCERAAADPYLRLRGHWNRPTSRWTPISQRRELPKCRA
jgi:hypothetical protein